jgi:hypothetical protein
MSKSLYPILAAVAAVFIFALAGCGAATSFSNPQASARVFGKVIGGQQPIFDAVVSIWPIGTTGYGSSSGKTPLARTLTAADGTFQFPDNAYPCKPNQQVYILAQGGEATPGIVNSNIALATGLGDCATAKTDTIEINEVTTAVTAFALGQFFEPTIGAGTFDSFGTDPADFASFALSNQSTIPMLVDISTGIVNPSTPSMTIEAAKIYSIANTLAACINDASGSEADPSAFVNCNTLFTNTTSPLVGATAPTDTLQAAVQMARYPYQNVPTLFGLASATAPFVGLPSAPADWTLGVSYTSSDYALAIAGTSTSSTSASIDIDTAGNIWFPSTLSGSTGIASFNPASATFSGPFLTSVFAQPQYLAIDQSGNAWATDATGQGIGYVSTSAPTVTTRSFPIDPTIISAFGPISVDDPGDVLFSYIDPPSTATVGAFINNDLSGSGLTFTYPPTGISALFTDPLVLFASTSGTSTPCALEYLGEGSQGFITDQVKVTTSSNCTSGGVVQAAQADDFLGLASSLDALCIDSQAACNIAPTNVNLPQGIATDGAGHEWIANSGNASVFTVGSYLDSPRYAAGPQTPYLHDTKDGNTMTAPYAIAIDGSGNLWIANAGCVTTSANPCIPGPFVLSELIGAAAPTITPLSAQMVGGGQLIGTTPGTVVPQSIAHPVSFNSSATGQNSSKSAIHWTPLTAHR